MGFFRDLWDFLMERRAARRRARAEALALEKRALPRATGVSSEQEKANAKRKARVALVKMKAEAETLDRESQALYAKAQEYARAGDEAAARRTLSAYRMKQNAFLSKERNINASESILDRMETAESQKETLALLQQISNISDVDIHEMQEMADTIDDSLDKLGDVDDIIHSFQGRVVRRVNNEIDRNSDIGSEEELLEKLYQEANNPNLADGVSEERSKAASVSAPDSRGRAEINKLLDEAQNKSAGGRVETGFEEA